MADTRKEQFAANAPNHQTGEGDRFWVALDITMDASKNEDIAPQIRTIVAAYRRPVYDEWTGRLVELGWTRSRAEAAVTMTAALITGTAIRTLWTEGNEGSVLSKAWLPLIMQAGGEK